MLRFMTCGSVDDGKSTLIGRLLWESKQVFEDHLSALAKDSTRHGTQGDALDLALLLDGLQAEREQGITIDVAYRFFSTARRRFVVADTPGHEQYTRNMATGASNSELAVLVVNAKSGLLQQALRHARIVSMLGIRHLLLAVNKMDQVTWDEAVFNNIVDAVQPLVDSLRFSSFLAIPVSALHGDNIVARSPASPWYSGPPLLNYLETIDVTRGPGDMPFRMAVQLVNRPNHDFRGYSGRIASGTVSVGDRVQIIPSGIQTRVRSIIAGQTYIENAKTGASITLCLEDEIDISRGDLVASAVEPANLSDQFEARILCLSEHRVVPGRTYIFHLHTCSATATITAVKHRVDVAQGSSLAARFLDLNEIGVVNLSLDRPVPYEPFGRCPLLGSFILIDRFTNDTIAGGMIEFALRRAANIRWQSMTVDKQVRAHQKLQKPICIWLTGLSGSGKSTIANLLEQRLVAAGRHTYLLDGDNIRHGLNRDLGFSEVDRVENIRRAAEVARLLVDAGLIVIVSFISPYRAERELARSLFQSGEFVEVFVDAPLEECERRDPKGLYAKARRGELANFTGIDSAYEPPASADIRLDTLQSSAENCVEQILKVMYP